jgi:hypothetical protein
MQTKEKLVTLCGLSKEETELDFSDQRLGAGDAVLIANDVSDMGAVSSLNVSDNMMKDAGTKQIAKLLSKCEDGKPFRSKGIFARLVCKHCGQKKDGHTAGALVMLDLSFNKIPKKQQVAIAALCKSRGVDLFMSEIDHRGEGGAATLEGGRSY